MTLHPHASAAEQAYLTERAEDGTILELARAHNAMSAIRDGMMKRAAGEEEPDLTDLGNPFAFIAEAAKTHQYEIAALLELAKAVKALRWWGFVAAFIAGILVGIGGSFLF